MLPLHRPVGRTGLQVMPLGLGTAPLGNLYAPVPDARARDTVRVALDAGLRFFDTAPLYGAGLAERRLGAALAAVPRDRYVLSTKVGRLVDAAGRIVPAYSREGVLRSIEASLGRLGVERLDVVHIHDPDDHFREAVEDMFPVLSDLRAQGVIGAIGAGMNQWQMLWEFAQNAEFDCFLLAGRYTLLEQTAVDFLAHCQERGIGILIGGAFNSGILATGPVPGAKYNYSDAPEEVLARARWLQAICDRHGVPLRTAALRFCLAHPAVTAVVAGAAHPVELADHVAALEAEIPAELWADLRREGLLATDTPTPA